MSKTTTIHCDQCHKDTEDFQAPRSKGYKTSICRPCAVKNMARWEAGHMVGKKPEDFAGLR